MPKLNILPENKRDFLQLLDSCDGDLYSIDLACYEVTKEAIILFFQDKGKPAGCIEDCVSIVLDADSIDWFAAHFGFTLNHAFMNKNLSSKKTQGFIRVLTSPHIISSIPNYLGKGELV